MNLGTARRIWRMETDYRALLDRLGHANHITCDCPKRDTLSYDLETLDAAIARLRVAREGTQQRRMTHDAH